MIQVAKISTEANNDGGARLNPTPHQVFSEYLQLISFSEVSTSAVVELLRGSGEAKVGLDAGINLAQSAIRFQRDCLIAL